MKWKNLPPMPKPDSHIEFAWVIVNHSIIIVGGTTEKHPITKKMVLVGEVFRFNLDSLVLIFTLSCCHYVQFYVISFRTAELCLLHDVCRNGQ